ncbi:hypothetical protein PoB_004016000 [Plakobranchus ocellatus]|uniref:Uncharacterized protein n=1 Tax=Plakobranchus ocellatus TaxID=259542 RepID=A0AAV4B234_9GAST|nr:hypothetical protein PoB_004016000 [Plakobranchus ocellatus]
MSSRNNMGTKRSTQKTYSAFNALPSLRGKDSKAAVLPFNDSLAFLTSVLISQKKNVPEKKFHRPPVFADQLLFPGRRLDRVQQSLVSGYSGRSLDIETIVSGGRPDVASVADSNSLAVGGGNPGGTPAPGLMGSASFTRSLNDITGGWTGGSSWDAVRQPLSSAHSQLTLNSRQPSRDRLRSRSGSRPSRTGMLGSTFPGASTSLGNLSNAGLGPKVTGLASGGFPVSSSKWKPAGPKAQDPGHSVNEKVLRDINSPDSSYSSESVSEQGSHSPQLALPPPAETVPRIQLNRQNSNNSSSHSNSNSTQYKKPKYLKRTSRRESRVSRNSPTPQLDKILWALVPDEFANISDTGVSDMGPSSHQDSASSRFVTFTDLEAGSGQGHTSRVPDTPRRPTLTEEILKSQNATQSVSTDDRIMQWLADCDEKLTNMNLPTHLPDISYTFKHAKH